MPVGFNFSIYSLDNVDPDLAVDSTSWKPDPRGAAEYDPRFQWEGRGAHTPTLGGMDHQDYGLEIQDRMIRIAGEDFTEALRLAIETKYEAVDTEFHFTSGLGGVVRVRFSRVPRGFTSLLDTSLFAKGIFVSPFPPESYRRYRYEILLHVISEVVAGEL